MNLCPNCKVPNDLESGCCYCYLSEPFKPVKRGFFRWLMQNHILYKLLQFSAVSIMNGIFVNHFKYSVLEMVVQAVCLGIVLPGIFNRE